MNYYRIVIPSRRRPHRIGRALVLLPTATVLVDRAEREDYLPVVGESRLAHHEGLLGWPVVVNYALRTFEEPALVFADDDIRRVVTLVEPRRSLSSEEVLAVIENMLQAMIDLDIGVGACSQTPNPMAVDPVKRPIRASGMACKLWIVRGRARKRMLNEAVAAHADLDYALTTLRDDRVMYIDQRFFVEAAPAFCGEGGAVDLLTKEHHKRSWELIKARWGDYVDNEPSRRQLGARMVGGTHMRVSRSNPTALK